MTFFDRYAAGECEKVWDDLVALGHEVRHATYFADAYAVAKETMGRVRCNVEIVAARLSSIGYEFERPESVFVPPIANAVTQIERIEESLGPPPLSLRAFYEVVGSVDFTQSTDQLIPYSRLDRVRANEVQILGEEDPLVVAPYRTWQRCPHLPETMSISVSRMMNSTRQIIAAARITMYGSLILAPISRSLGCMRSMSDSSNICERPSVVAASAAESRLLRKMIRDAARLPRSSTSSGAWRRDWYLSRLISSVPSAVRNRLAHS